MKMFVAAAAYDPGALTRKTIHQRHADPGLRDREGERLRSPGHGPGHLEDGIAYSRNIVAARSARMLGKNVRAAAASSLYGMRIGWASVARPGSRRPARCAGLVVDPATRQWAGIDLANRSFGQGGCRQPAPAGRRPSRPWSTAASSCGRAWWPTWPVNRFEAVPPEQVLDARVSTELRDLMRHVVTKVPWYRKGTQIKGYAVGGKTGTAQIWDSSRGKWMHNVFNFSFVGYVGRTQRPAGGDRRHPHRAGQAARRRPGLAAAQDHVLRALPSGRARHHRHVGHPATGHTDPCRARRMSGAWTPVAAVAERPEADRERRLVGFGADELAAIVGGRLLRRRHAPDQGRRPSTAGASDRARPSWPCPASAPTGIVSWSTPRASRSGRPHRDRATGLGPVERPVPPEVRRHPRRGRPGGAGRHGRRLARPASRRSWSPSRGRTPRRPPRRPQPAVLAARLRTLKSEGNQNNEIGLPLTLLRLGPEHEAAVVEMGMYVAGDIAALAAPGDDAQHRGRHRGQRRAPRTRRLAGDHRAREGRLVEALPPGGTRHPQRRRPAPCVAWRPRTAGARPDLRLRAPTPDVSATDARSLGTDGMRFILRTPTGESRWRRRRSAACSASTTPSPRPRVGTVAGFEAEVIADALAGGFSAPHRTSRSSMPAHGASWTTATTRARTR